MFNEDATTFGAIPEPVLGCKPLIARRIIKPAVQALTDHL